MEKVFRDYFEAMFAETPPEGNPRRQSIA